MEGLAKRGLLCGHGNVLVDDKPRSVLLFEDNRPAKVPHLAEGEARGEGQDHKSCGKKFVAHGVLQAGGIVAQEEAICERAGGFRSVGFC